MKTTISTHSGTKFSIKHNIDPDFRNKQSHIENANVEMVREYVPIRDMYKQLFQDSVDEYNAKQTRKDRQIEDYYNKIKNDKHKNVAHEMIVQVGSKDQPIDRELSKKILREFVDKFEQKFPNMKIFCCAMHLDEQTPHLHLDTIPVSFENSRGMKTQVSMTGALREMGYTNGKKFEEQGLIQYTKDVNMLLETICNKYGIEIEHPMRDKKEEIEHLSVDEYKLKQLKQEYKDLTNKVDKAQKTYEYYNNQTLSIKNTLEELQSQQETQEQKIIDQKRELETLQQEAHKYTIEHNENILGFNVSQLKKATFGNSYIITPEQLQELNEKANDNYNQARQNRLQYEDTLKDVSTLRDQKDFVKRELETTKNELDNYKNKSKENKVYKDFYEWLKPRMQNFDDVKNQFNKYQEQQEIKKQKQQQDNGIHR